MSRHGSPSPGCHRIAALAERDDTILWGNHDGIERARADLGETRSLLEWWPGDDGLQGSLGPTRT